MPVSKPVYLKTRKVVSGLAWMRFVEERSNPGEEYGKAKVGILF